MSTPNAFETARPRSAQTQPTTPPPQRGAKGKAPPALAGSGVQHALDRSGRRTVSLAPRVAGAGFSIEPSVSARAAAEKRFAMRKAGI